MNTYFVHPDSIVRKIWGKADTILFIFAGASAEFALNRSVDWLYFTGRLPSDPLGRLFSTVEYAQQIIFAEQGNVLRAIDQITAIHKNVELSRGFQIPGEAYLEVLSMLIDYSIRSYELLERKLTEAEKSEVFEVFYNVGKRMVLADLPLNYPGWLIVREKQLAEGLCFSKYTPDLYTQYKKHLGAARYFILKQAQALVAPDRVVQLLSLGEIKWLLPALYSYKFFRIFKIERLLKNAIMPPLYLKQVQALDHAPRT